MRNKMCRPKFCYATRRRAQYSALSVGAIPRVLYILSSIHCVTRSVTQDVPRGVTGDSAAPCCVGALVRLMDHPDARVAALTVKESASFASSARVARVDCVRALSDPFIRRDRGFEIDLETCSRVLVGWWAAE